jgi:cytochrome c oxidase subunit 3/cytochrome o ubiquinol oxidase subunit 3
MATIPLQHAPGEPALSQPTRGVMAMACLIIAESAIFTIFVVAYLYFAGRDTQGPRPRDVLEVPIFYTVCLLSSSLFIVLAEHAIDRARMAAFRLWWSVTILLGLTFLYGTAVEWRKLIVDDHLTIRTNLFGTTYYSLVGLHASHVVIGLILMLFTLAFALLDKVTPRHAYNVRVLAMYWHFVDAVWVVVFTVVYVVCR